MIYVCIICTGRKPSLSSLSGEHRQILEAIMSPTINLAQLKCFPLWTCASCQALINAVETFRNKALAGASHLLSRLALVQVQQDTHLQPEDSPLLPVKQDPDDLLEAKSFVEFEIDVEKLKPQELEGDVKTECLDSDDNHSETSDPLTSPQGHLGQGSLPTLLETAKLKPQELEGDVKTECFDSDDNHSETSDPLTSPQGHLGQGSLPTLLETAKPATAVQVRDNRLAPFMQQRLVPARGLARGAPPAGRGAPPAGRGAAKPKHAAVQPAVSKRAAYLPTLDMYSLAAPGSSALVNRQTDILQPATAVQVRDNRLAPFMQQRLVPARGLARGAPPAGRAAPPAGRGAAKPEHAAPVNLPQKTGKQPRLLPKPSPAANSTGTANKPADTQAHTEPVSLKDPSKRSSNPWYIHVLKDYEVASERHVTRKSKEYAEAEFRCEPCVRTFASAAVAEAHATLHLASAGPFACSVCTVRARSVRELAAHRALHAVRYHCCRCRYTTPHKQMVEIHSCAAQQQPQESPLAGHNGRRRYYHRPIKCKHCFVAFSHDVALAVHVAKHHTEPPVPAECKECGKMFKSKYFLKRHSYQHKKKGLEDLRPELFCAECKIPFPSLSAYETHRSSLKHSNKDDWKYECDYCGRKCPAKGALARHIKSLHTMDRKFKCEQCSKAYVSRGQLRRHAMSHSPGSRPRPHVCDKCGKAFLVKGTLRQHMNIHNGLRPYACKHCPATFSFSAALYTHNQLKHLKVKREVKKKGPKKKVEQKELGNMSNEES